MLSDVYCHERGVIHRIEISIELSLFVQTYFISQRNGLRKWEENKENSSPQIIRFKQCLGWQLVVKVTDFFIVRWHIKNIAFFYTIFTCSISCHRLIICPERSFTISSTRLTVLSYLTRFHDLLSRALDFFYYLGRSTYYLGRSTYHIEHSTYLLELSTYHLDLS